MSDIIAGHLDVLPDGRLVPYVNPGARAPLADVHQMLSPRLARDLETVSRDLDQSMPYHLTSHSFKNPTRFARDVHRLGKIVSLHATLAEATLVQKELLKDNPDSPLAKHSPWAALALTLPHPPADKLDAFHDWLDAPVEEDPQNPSPQVSDRKSGMAPAPSPYPSHPSHSPYSPPLPSAPSGSPALGPGESEPSPLLNSLQLVENLSDTSSPFLSTVPGTPDAGSASSNSSGVPDPASSSRCIPFNAPLCLERISNALAALSNLNPRRSSSSGFRLRFPVWLHPSDSSVSTPEHPSSSARIDAPSQISNFKSQIRPPGPQPSVAVLSSLFWYPSHFPELLGAVSLDRLHPDPIHPIALGRKLHARVATELSDWIYPFIYGRSSSSSWVPNFAHAPP